MSDRMRELFRIVQAASSRLSPGLQCRILAVLACGLAVSACSLSVPMAGLGADDIPTGTIRTADRSPLAAELDAEDWRRAKSALDTALDPQGNGASVTWDNPQSGTKGVFVPVAQAYPKDDAICRAFSAQISLKGKSDRSVRSSACRKNGGAWVIGPVKTLDRVARTAPHKNNNLAERDTNTQLN